jgi:hypothetical protein
VTSNMEGENAASWMFLRFWHDNDLFVWHALHITSYAPNSSGLTANVGPIAFQYSRSLQTLHLGC